jgi:hypothetical protein
VNGRGVSPVIAARCGLRNERFRRHGRACPGHPDHERTEFLANRDCIASLSGIAGTSPAMTERNVWMLMSSDDVAGPANEIFQPVDGL